MDPSVPPKTAEADNEQAQEPDASPQGEADVSKAAPTPGESQTTRKRKIRIGSQRSATPVSSLKAAPQSLDMRTPKPSAPSPPAESPSAEAVSPAASPAQPARKEKPEQPSFSDMAAEQSPEIAASVAKVLGQQSEPETTEEAPEEVTATDVPEVQFKEQTNEDVEQEIEAALGGMSLDDILAGEELATETRLPGTVMKVGREYVFFSLGSRNQGVAGLRQFKEPPSPGETMDVIIQKFDAEEGLYEVTVPGASVTVADWGDVDEGVVVEARVTGHNTGGLECEVNHIRGFIPMGTSGSWVQLSGSFATSSGTPSPS